VIATKRGKHRLLFEMADTFKWQLFAPVFPRIVRIAFTFCQPLLLNRFISYLAESEGPESANIGYGLIAAYGIVYLGLAVGSTLTKLLLLCK
jgi:ATP-binding cassette subfamily C (CFTR/MRP) protein 1